MDLYEYQKLVTRMTDAELQKARADLRQSIRKARRSTTLHYDKEQRAEYETAQVKLKVVQDEITERIRGT